MNYKVLIWVIIILVVGLAAFFLIFGDKKEVAKDVVTPIEKIETEIPLVVSESKQEENLTIKQNTMPVVKIKTNKGDITLELFSTDAPKTVGNFITLAKKGFYDGVIFHRVISGFMIQGGDPTGTGAGGPGYQFADELNPETPSYQNGYTRGTVAMANAGPNTNGSQFFIMHKDTPLPHAYTIFGKVTAGMETVDVIAASQVNSSDRPLEDVIMSKVEVEE
ncbi:MAG: peptidylprolyl isomerase [Patescibacteria group bacterium]